MLGKTDMHFNQTGFSTAATPELGLIGIDSFTTETACSTFKLGQADMNVRRRSGEYKFHWLYFVCAWVSSQATSHYERPWVELIWEYA